MDDDGLAEVMADETKIDVNGKADIRNGEPIGQVIENRDDWAREEDNQSSEGADDAYK